MRTSLPATSGTVSLLPKKGTCTNTTPGRLALTGDALAGVCDARTCLVIPGLMNCFVCQESARRVRELEERDYFNKSYFKPSPLFVFVSI